MRSRRSSPGPGRGGAVGRACSVCEHPDRDAIDEAIATGALSNRAISNRFGPSASAVGRHGRAHVSPAIEAVVVEREAERLGGLVERIEALIGRVEKLIADAEAGRKPGQVLAGVAEARRLLELLGKATGELKETPALAINVLASPEFIQAQRAIVEALAPYPDARIAVSEALQALPAPEDS